MGILKKIIHILANLCYIGIIIYVLLVMPKIFGNEPVVVLTGSMEPKYKVGTIIYYSKVEKDEIKVNDVITFKTSNNEIVTHRVNNIVEDRYETKGDANETTDPKLVEYEDIVGKVGKFYIPYVGYGINFINNHLYLIVFVVIILVLEFVFANVNFNNNIKEGEENNEISKK